MSKDLFKQAIDGAITQDAKQRDSALKQIFAQKAAEILSRDKQKQQQ